jgi:hypothetical protein
MLRKLMRLLIAVMIAVGTFGLRAIPAHAEEYHEEIITNAPSTKVYDYTFKGENVEIYGNYPNPDGFTVGMRFGWDPNGYITIKTLNGRNITKIEGEAHSIYHASPNPDHGTLAGYDTTYGWSSFTINNVNSPTVTITKKEDEDMPSGEKGYGSLEINVLRIFYEKDYQEITVPTAVEGLVYNGEMQTLVTPAEVINGNKDEGSVTYSLDQIEWTTEVPKASHPATDYTVYYKVAGNRTYFEYSGGPILVSIAKATPELPTDLYATVGQTLGDVQLPVHWKWKYNDVPLNKVGDWENPASCSSPDPEFYDGIGEVMLIVHVRENPELKKPDGLTAAYGKTLADVKLTNPEGNIPGTWTWQDETLSIGDVGTHTFKADFMPEDEAQYRPVKDVELTVEVTKADPVVTAPGPLTARYGQYLRNLTLNNPEGNIPGTWVWEDENTRLDKTGTYTYKANFTPEDTSSYNAKENVDVTVRVTNPLADDEDEENLSGSNQNGNHPGNNVPNNGSHSGSYVPGNTPMGPEYYSNSYAYAAPHKTESSSSEKSESSSSSSSNTAQTDTVVTCQMAGYPSNYAWNESAKACQAGYIDANGVFRAASTANTARTGIPNTYDKGIYGHMAAFASSVICGLLSAYMLRRH